MAKPFGSLLNSPKIMGMAMGLGSLVLLPFWTACSPGHSQTETAADPAQQTQTATEEGKRQANAFEALNDWNEDYDKLLETTGLSSFIEKATLMEGAPHRLVIQLDAAVRPLLNAAIQQEMIKLLDEMWTYNYRKRLGQTSLPEVLIVDSLGPNQWN